MRVFTSKKVFFLASLVSLISVWLSLPTFALANLTDKLSNVEDPTGLIHKFSSLGDIIGQLIPFLFGLAAMLALLFLIWGGIKYMMAQGDPKQLDAAKNTITGAIIGLVVILSVSIIYTLIGLILGIKILGRISSPVYAKEGVSIVNLLPFTFQDFGSFFTVIILFALFAAALIFFGLIVWGGIRYLNAGGDQDSIERAKNTLTGAGIGLLIVVVSFVIIEIITNIFKIKSVFSP